MNEQIGATTDELRCRELVALVTAYLEEALSADDRERFERHLAHCVGCQRYLEQMRRTIALTGQLREDELSPKVRDELLTAFHGWRRGGA
jgi:anti-sigma factor RsiW